MNKLDTRRVLLLVMVAAGASSLATVAVFGVYNGYTLPLLPAGVVALAAAALLARNTPRDVGLLVLPAVAVLGASIYYAITSSASTIYGAYHTVVLSLAALIALYSALAQPASTKAKAALALLLAFTAYLGVYAPHTALEPLVPLLLAAGIMGLTGVGEYSTASASIAITAPIALSSQPVGEGFYLLGGIPAWIIAARTRDKPLMGLALLHATPAVSVLAPGYHLLAYTAAVLAFSLSFASPRLLLAPLAVAAGASVFYAGDDPVHKALVFTGVFAVLAAIIASPYYARGIRARLGGAVAGAAGLVIALSLLVPAVAVSASDGACEPGLGGLGYTMSNETIEYSNVYDAARSLASEAESLFQGLQPGDKEVLLLLLESPVPARIIGPGEVAAVTIVDFTTGENYTVNTSRGFLVLPLEDSVEAYYAVDESGEQPLVRVAVRLPSIGLPYDILGSVQPSPVHSAIKVEFAAPLIIQLPYNDSMIVYEAVIGSSFILGERTTEVEETPFGIVWTNAVLGVTRGAVVGPVASIELPYQAGDPLLEALTEIARPGDSPHGREALRAVAPLLDGEGPALIPKWVASGSPGLTGPQTVLAMAPEPLKGQTPYPLYQGADACIVYASPGEAGYTGYRAPYDVVIVLREAYRSGASPEVVYSLALDLTGHNETAAAQALWLAVHWDLASNGAPDPALEGVEASYVTISLLAPFIAVPAPFLWLVTRGTSKPTELTPGTEPELAED